jgi:hypothetical protein
MPGPAKSVAFEASVNNATTKHPFLSAADLLQRINDLSLSKE